MVKSVENGISLPPFLVKCYEMVNDESTDELISWSESNDSFIIWDESRFSSQLLPKYFKHNNFSSFVRQLNIYGFKKIDTDHWQFANEAFVKGHKHLLKNIYRRKQPQNLAPKKNPSSQHQDETGPTPQSEQDKTVALWKEVETLKTDKTALTQELKKLSQHQQTSQNKMLLLREQLKGMEQNQQQMLSFIVMAMQSPEFMIQFFQPKNGNTNTKLSEVTDDFCEPTTTAPSEGAIVRYHPEASRSDDLMELDFSSDEIRDLFMDIDVLLGPVEDKSITVENQGEDFVLPEASENDNMLEQLLLPYPSTENEQIDGQRIGLTIESDESDDVDECRDDVSEETSGRVDALTEKMETLTSGMR
ncbi:heat stress transcription factor a-8 [Phtheirospermum japonicum]|uniref:Heat stress transcription factor n=1 Tax=Phtheirospermum japonicum TaxID=374723 RepID=A0A830B7D3_9LAMI|nr:heat stress transcription factor a-8 [Phtheirospermum japonicum]